MSTKTLVWLGVSGWVLIPLVFSMLATNSLRSQLLAMDAGLVLMGVAFAIGAVGFLRRLRGPRTAGLLTVGSLHVIGLLGLASLAILGFRTQDSDRPDGDHGTILCRERTWLWHTLERSFGYRGLAGDFTIAPRFQLPFYPREGLAVVSLGGRWGAIDRTGEWAIPALYDEAFPMVSEGKIAVRHGERWGYIDRTGRVLIPYQFEWAGAFSMGLAVVEIGGKWGYVDPAGKLAIEPRFDAAREFAEGLAAVNVGGEVRSRRVAGGVLIGFSGGRWGYVDSTGEYAIEPRFREAQAFRGGRAVVVDGEGDAVIDRSGRVTERLGPPDDYDPPEE